VTDTTVRPRKDTYMFDYNCINEALINALVHNDWTMLFAFVGITKVINNAYSEAIICLMFAGICDMFDGAVASTKKRNCYEKHFGIQIDSLCDLISFGLLPALFVYMIAEKNALVGGLVGIYTLCGLIRLAYFNVQEFERQKTTSGRREVYLGVPITSSAIVIPLGYLLYSRVDLIGTWIFPLMIILLGGGFIAGIEIRKPNIVGKITMIAVGILELLGVFILSGADIL